MAASDELGYWDIRLGDLIYLSLAQEPWVPPDPEIRSAILGMVRVALRLRDHERQQDRASGHRGDIAELLRPPVPRPTTEEFDSCWRVLESKFLADALGSAEYRRLLARWHEQGKPAVAEWLLRHVPLAGHRLPATNAFGPPQGRAGTPQRRNNRARWT